MAEYLSRYAAFAARSFLALSLVAFGIQHLVSGAFVTRLVPGAVGTWALPLAGAKPFGVLLILVGVLLAASVRVRETALFFTLLCAVSTALLHIPATVSDVVWGATWTSAGKACAFTALGLLLVRTASNSTAARRRNGIDRLALPIACALFSAFLIVAGIQHFVWAAFVKTLVPTWAGMPLAWTYISGAGLIVGGVGLLLHPFRTVAAAVLGTVIFIWVWTLHVPRALTMLNANESTAVFEALSFAGLGWLIAAASLRERAAGMSTGGELTSRAAPLAG